MFNSNVFVLFEFAGILLKNKCSYEYAGYIAISSVMGFLAQKGEIANCASEAALTYGVKFLAVVLAN
jgi:hypothetical protein